MARVQVETVFSDITGQAIEDGNVWTMELVPEDKRRNKVTLDVSEADIRDFLSKGTEVKRRGRKPGSKNKPKAE